MEENVSFTYKTVKLTKECEWAYHKTVLWDRPLLSKGALVWKCSQWFKKLAYYANAALTHASLLTQMQH
jgi:hypothetical protein